MGQNIVDICEHGGPTGVFIASPRRGVTKIVTEADVENFAQNMMAFILNDAPAGAAVVLDLESSSVRSLRRARIFSVNYAALPTASGMP